MPRVTALARMERLDPELYDIITESDPFYKKILEIIAKEVVKYAKLYNKKRLEILEPGSGTGNLTVLLGKISEIDNEITGIDKDAKVFFVLRRKIKFIKCIKVKKANAVRFIHTKPVDVVAMSIVFHEIDDKDKEDFLANMYRHLNPGGLIVIGDKFISEYENEEERDVCLKNYCDYRVKVYKQILTRKIDFRGMKVSIGDIFVRSEAISLGDGLKREGDWKISVNHLKELLKRVGFGEINVQTIIPDDIENMSITIGGRKYNIDPNKMAYKVVTAKKPNSGS